MNKAINTNNAPAAIGPYSQAIEANGMVFASGQLPIDPATGNFAEGGIKEQTRQSLTNAQNILKEAGTDLAHVVKTTVFLSDMANFGEMNEVYSEFFTQPFPARRSRALYRTRCCCRPCRTWGKPRSVCSILWAVRWNKAFLLRHQCGRLSAQR